MAPAGRLAPFCILPSRPGSVRTRAAQQSDARHNTFCAAAVGLVAAKADWDREGRPPVMVWISFGKDPFPLPDSSILCCDIPGSGE